MHHPSFTPLVRAFFPILVFSWCLVSNAQAQATAPVQDSLTQLASEFADPTTYYLVAKKYYRGDEYPQDKARAAKWFKKAADAGHVNSQWHLGRMYATGDGVDKDFSKAVRYLSKAATKGNDDAAYQLGLLYLSSNKPDPGAAEQWLTVAAKQEHAEAALDLGKLLIKQNKDRIQAEHWLQLAAQLGLKKAEQQLAALKANQQPVAPSTETNSETAEADSETPATPAETQDNNASGETDQSRISKALRDLQYRSYQQETKMVSLRSKPDYWFHNTLEAETAVHTAQTQPYSKLPLQQSPMYSILRDAEKGRQAAQYKIGLSYLEGGQSLQQDSKLAIDWLQRAARNHHQPAQIALGDIYLSGRRISKDYSRALEWYKMAAAAGSAEAQFKLGTMYQRGLGVKRDPQQARRWFQQSASQGFAQAQKKLDGCRIC